MVRCQLPCLHPFLRSAQLLAQHQLLSALVWMARAAGADAVMGCRKSSAASHALSSRCDRPEGGDFNREQQNRIHISHTSNTRRTSTAAVSQFQSCTSAHCSARRPGSSAFGGQFCLVVVAKIVAAAPPLTDACCQPAHLHCTSCSPACVSWFAHEKGHELLRPVLPQGNLWIQAGEGAGTILVGADATLP